MNRSLSQILGIVSLPLSLGSLVGGCTTDAVAIEDCREIESARCEASVPCGVITSAEVKECQRVYREQCLHGIAGPKAPTADQQKQCVNLIVEAGQRATELAEELASAPEGETDGDAGETSPAQSEYGVSCRIISEPWRREECNYLNEETGAGGADGEGDDAE